MLLRPPKPVGNARGTEGGSYCLDRTQNTKDNGIQTRAVSIISYRQDHDRRRRFERARSVDGQSQDRNLTWSVV